MRASNFLIIFLGAFFMVLLLFVLFTLLILTKWYRNFQYDIATNFKNSCDVPSGYFAYAPLPVGLLYPTYNQPLASFLLLLCLNVSISLCPQFGPLPIPIEFYQNPVVLVDRVSRPNRTYGYVFSTPTKVVVTYVGTMFMDQWEKDFEIRQVYPEGINNITPDTLVHKGFYDIYSSIRQQLFDALAAATCDNRKPIVIAGHSLGGALATITAVDLMEYQPVIYTFGAPRVFNVAGAKIVDRVANFQRINNTEDVITALPLPVTKLQLEPFYTMPTWVYSQAGTNLPFTLNLGNLSANHILAYLKVIVGSIR